MNIQLLTFSSFNAVSGAIEDDVGMRNLHRVYMRFACGAVKCKIFLFIKNFLLFQKLSNQYKLIFSSVSLTFRFIVGTAVIRSTTLRRLIRPQNIAR